jgi:SAM-dependent methyltransferase
MPRQPQSARPGPVVKLGKRSGGIVERLLRGVRERARRIGFERRRRFERSRWEGRWSRADFAPRWLGRAVPPELEAARAEGWLPSGGPALDVGCGEGDVAAWLAALGHPTVGVDIARSAVERARKRHGESPGRLEFQVLDVCRDALPERGFRVLVDRGCLHVLTRKDARRYGRNVAAVAAPGARLLLFMKAFRDGAAVGDAAETERIAARVRAALVPAFRIERMAATWLDPRGGADPARALPGLAFWLTRC